MAHSLIIGQTESGKSTLARALCAKYRARGIGCIVLDASFGKWDADFITHDFDTFMDCVLESRGCALFIDEAGEQVSWLQKDAVNIATKYRHFGHFAHFIAQGYTMVAPGIRRNCTRLFLFSLPRADCVEMAREWTHEELSGAYKLRPGEFFSCSRFDPPVLKKIF